MSTKVILAIISVVVLIGGIVAGVILVRQKQILDKKAAPATNLTLVADNANLNIGDTLLVNVNIDTGPNTIIGVELYITFDKNKLRLNSLSTGSFLNNPNVQTQSIDNATGNATYILFLPTGTSAQSGQGTIASLNMEAIASGTASIGLSPSTLVAAVGVDTGVNVLESINPTSVNIASPQPQVTSSPTPTTTAGFIPSPTSTPTPTAIISQAASPTPTTSQSAGTGGALTPTPTTAASPTPTSASSPATSQVKITSIKDGQVIADTTPTFSGTASPNATITITINSPDEIKATVTANSSGAWSYTPTTPLSEGAHSAVIVAQSTTGTTSSESIDFTISSAQLPDSGISFPAILGLAFGLIFLLLSGAFFNLARKVN